ncbi:hypothetical protein [Halobacterium salinarum]|uniref:hypothetical protein n=1 Tax=Halobacterium salinarum TaxID=2242 RepID=UPI002553F9D1|nr:hypothetical protein [Halobacterium salinarum]MDL0134442.1 hypothetical protein [Halobacterium salinarum]
MTGDSDLHPTLRPNYQIAERVRLQMELFVHKFRDLNEGGQLAEILRTSKTLPGVRVEQQPEVFTEQYLIEPVLHGLGYWSPTSEQHEAGGTHFIRRPITYRKVEPRHPDYLLKNVGDAVVCLVEAKAANRERMHGSKQAATADIRQYLEEDTFCKYLRNLDHEYLVGIGTDGLRWTLWMKHLQTGELRKDTPKVDLPSIVEREAIRADTIDGNVELGRGTDRETLSEELIPAFAARNLSEHVRRSFTT